MATVSNEVGLVSVIVPAYNRIDYIAETIESVMTQSYSNIELIVVDDGSSDGTYELLEKMANSGKLKLFSHPNRENKGQSAAINIGLKVATGEFVAILDSDDLFESNKLNAQVGYLDSNPQVGMVYGNGQAISADGKPLFKTLPEDHIETGDPNNILLDCYIAIPGGALVRKKVIEQVGYFNEDYRAAQDHDMAIRIFENTKVHYLPEVAFLYRKHDDSISQKSLERRWRVAIKILQSAKSRFPYKKSTLRKRAAVINFRLAQVLINSKTNIIEGIYRLLLSGILDPIRAIKVVFGFDKSKI